MTDQPWYTAPLVAGDLEGTGAQDREHEAILEIALVPLADGAPVLDDAFSTLVNPERPVPRRPWISPGLTDATLAAAPVWGAVAGVVVERISERWLVGHNIGVDWRLIARHTPELRIAGLIDTYRLARAADLPGKLSLSAVVDLLRLTPAVRDAVPDGQPHRALWDTIATAMLLPVLVSRLWPGAPPTIAALAECSTTARTPAQADTLF